jgi:hypothetical protein
MMASKKIAKKTEKKPATPKKEKAEKAILGKKFKILDKDGGFPMGDHELGENNVYIKIYGKVVGNGVKPSDLEVGETTQKEFNLSGSKATYTIQRTA